MPKRPAKTNLHALIVGVDAYREDISVSGAIFPKLSGCVNDAEDVANYLAQNFGTPAKPPAITKLYDEAATKPAVVAAIRALAAKAKKNDAVLIYYSGHGTCEDADTEIWTDQSNQRLEAIVCHYDHNRSPDFLLTDKELRFLIGELSAKTKAHVTAIFDCCHSGDNTRSVLEPNIAVRRVDFVFPQREWKDFVFAERLPRAAFLGKSVSELLPQGAHVQMSAAESDEPAVEVGGHGVFTTHLLEALRNAGGCLSYRDLHARLRNRMRVVYEQKPKLFAPAGHDSLLQEGFLKKPAGAASGGTLVFNKAKRSWMLDRGVLHGVAAGVTKALVKLADGKTLRAEVAKAGLDDAALKFTDQDFSKLDSKKAYAADLEGVQRQVVKVRLASKDAAPAEAEDFLKKLDTAENAAFFAFDDLQPDYDLVLVNGFCLLTKPGDPFRPLVQPVEMSAGGAAKTMENDLRHVSNWLYLKRLENKGANALPENTLQAQFFRVEADGSQTPLQPSPGKTLRLDLQQTEDGWGGSVKIVLTNKSKVNLYVAAAYLQEDFSSTPALLEPAVKMIEPGKSETVFEHEGGTIPFVLEPKLYWYNWRQGSDTLKFVFSTADFDAGAFVKSALPPPPLPSVERDGTRGLAVDSKAPALNGWASLDYRLEFPNPEFDKGSLKKAEAMFQAAEQALQGSDDLGSLLAHFAAGLYVERSGLSAKAAALRLAADGDAAAQRGGLAWDAALAVANKWSNFWRNRRYHSTAKRLPGAPHLVAEGDSWFQHPLLADIIDNVGRHYPVYCLSAAGDTIRNYVKGNEFMEAVEKRKPAAFLLSGGGNDILGDNLVNFLAENTPASSLPELFFNEKLSAELDGLVEIYRQIFTDFAAKFPEVHVLVHGYDYPRPLPPKSEKRSWLGKFFDQKGIGAEPDRSAAVRYLMDTFNQRLAAVAAEFPKAHYLDLRSIVRDDQWDDEIHPNDDGYASVSQRFMLKLNSLLAKPE